jgi:hypothetical protein
MPEPAQSAQKSRRHHLSGAFTARKVKSLESSREHFSKVKSSTSTADQPAKTLQNKRAALIQDRRFRFVARDCTFRLFHEQHQSHLHKKKHKPLVPTLGYLHDTSRLLTGFSFIFAGLD